MTTGIHPAGQTKARRASHDVRYMFGKTCTFLISCMLGAMVVPRWSDAHHSVAAFDPSRTVEIAGTLTDAKIANPHSVFHVSVRDAQGREVTWIIEGAGASTILREVRGGPANRFAPGQAVTATFYPARDGKHTGNLVSLRFGDGQVLSGIRIP